MTAVKMRSLKSRNDALAEPSQQLESLETSTERILGLPRFGAKLRESGLWPYKPLRLEIFQVNMGKMCNQVCKHCHVDAGPDRREIMTQATMTECLEALRRTPTATTVDLTGGAPEMNANFRWFVTEIRKLRPDLDIIVRCNLTIILANKKYNDLPQLFRENRVHGVSSLPFYQKGATDRQRGDGVFDSSIEALKMLNEVGYAKEGTGLKLDLVYNPVGAFLPGPQVSLEKEFKRELKQSFGIEFNQLFAITNMPISRYLEYLSETGNLEDYMQTLVEAYNPEAARTAMCRNTISIGWDGQIYDCDFNQMLELNVASPSKHVKDWQTESLTDRVIITRQHCYGCPAGGGSRCGGTTT